MTSVAPKAIPGIREWPLLGSALDLRRDLLGVYARVVRECGDIGSFHLGPLRAVLVNAPDLIQSLLIDHAQDYDKGIYQHRAFEPMVGKGLIISEGEFHKRQRKLMAPLFQPRHVSDYADTIVARTRRNQATWSDNHTFNLATAMTHLTMGVVGQVLLSTEVSTEADELGAAVTVALQWANYTLTSLFPLPLWVPTARNRCARRARAVLRRRVSAMIAERRVSQEHPADLLSLLLFAHDEHGHGMDDEQLRDEILTAFVAGHETGASALTWSCYLLAREPEIYDALQSEVDVVLGGRPATAADLPRLPFTLQVFKEAMRLYPPVAAVLRVARRDTELDGYFIRKGTVVMLSQYILHRRPDVFPDPERFDPLRFAPERELQLPRYAYLPFGTGHRTCIGSHLALVEGQLVLATLAQHVRFELVDMRPAVPEFVITLRPRGGVAVRVRRRSVPVDSSRRGSAPRPAP